MSPFIFWLGIIFVLTGLPGYAFPDNQWWQFVGFDKFVHAGMFLVLTMLWCWGMDRTPYQVTKSFTIKSAALIGFFFASFTEVMQRLVFIQRSADMYDYLANGFGVFLAIVLSYKWILK